MYLDEPRAFYNALGGGKANKSSLASILAKIANPWSRLSKNAKRAKDDKGDAVKGNFDGEGYVHGGVYVVQAGGKPYYAHAEAEIGEHLVHVVAHLSRAGVGATDGQSALEQVSCSLPGA